MNKVGILMQELQAAIAECRMRDAIKIHRELGVVLATYENAC
jgi:hypothetical protein